MDVLTDLIAFRKVTDEVHDQIDRIKVNNDYSITKYNAELAKAKISSAVDLITGNKDRKKKLSSSDICRMVNLISELASGRIRMIQFQMMEGDLGIHEVFSGKVFHFEP